MSRCFPGPAVEAVLRGTFEMQEWEVYQGSGGAEGRPVCMFFSRWRILSRIQLVAEERGVGGSDAGAGTRFSGTNLTNQMRRFKGEPVSAADREARITAP